MWGCHRYRGCRAKPRATGRTWQGTSSSFFLLPQLCRSGDVSVGLGLSSTVRKGLQVSSKPAGSTPPRWVPQDKNLHSSTGHKCAAAQASNKCPTATRKEALMSSRSHRPHRAACHRAQGPRHRRQLSSQDGKTAPSPSRDRGRRRLRPDMAGDHPGHAHDFIWTPRSTCQPGLRLKQPREDSDTQVPTPPLPCTKPHTRAEQLRNARGVEVGRKEHPEEEVQTATRGTHSHHCCYHRPTDTGGRSSLQARHPDSPLILAVVLTGLMNVLLTILHTPPQLCMLGKATLHW